VESVLISVARPIDPGEHQIHAEAAGFSAQSKSFTVADAGKASVTLELAPAPPGATPPGAPEIARAPQSPTSSSPERATPSSSSDSATRDVAPSSKKNGKRIASYVAFGVGAIGLGMGTFFVASSVSKHSQADDKFKQCGGASGCTDDNPLSRDVSSLDDSARSAEKIGIVGLVTGGLGVATGVTLFVLSRRQEPAAASFRIEPRIGFGSAGVAGTF
jgi:hypothetical protein